VTRVLNVGNLLEDETWKRQFQIEWGEGDLRVTTLSLGTANMNKVWIKAMECFLTIRDGLRAA
jgi:hypothetical protein